MHNIAIVHCVLSMQDSSWSEWLTVFGYVGFTVFVMWRVFATGSK